MALRWDVVAKAEMHPVRLAVLEHFASASEPLTATMVARALGIQLDRANFHVHRLHERGLLTFDREDGAGSSLKFFYRLSDEAAV